MGNQGLDGSELGKVVEPVVTRHFPAGEAAPHCLCLETRAGTLESVYLRVSPDHRPGARRAAWHQPARVEHRVSVELVAEPINKGGGWRARVEEPSVPPGWRLPGSAAAVWPGPWALNPSSLG